MSLAALIAISSCDQYANVGVLPAQDAQVSSDAGLDAAAGDILSIQECDSDPAAGLSADAVAALRVGGPLASDARVLYPYEGTVFPAGMAAPLLMWSGAGADAVLLRARSGRLRYEGCLVPDAAGELTLPDTLWRAAAQQSQGKDDALELELTALVSGRAAGPLRVSITVSPTPLRGTLYYSRYSLPGVSSLNIAAVMRLNLGAAAEEFAAPSGTCAGCHAASANGSAVLLASTGTGQAYRLAQDGTATRLLASIPGAEYAAIDPLGTFYVAGALTASAGPRRLAPGPVAATLFQLDDVSEAPNSGLPAQALTPAFSPDGAWLAFNDASDSAGHVLAAMAFARDQRTFTDYHLLVSDEARFPAWPSFRPGSRQVVFALGETSDFTASGALISRAAPGPASDLYLTSLDGGEPTLLFRAMGFESSSAATDEATYLPFGSEDLHQNYYPSVLPSGSADYDWVFFDSVRHYGNRGVVRAIWCAALDVAEDGALHADPSHPPFYVMGQGEGSPNLRPIAANALPLEAVDK